MASPLDDNLPVTLLITRRVAAARYNDFLAWLHEGEDMASAFPGYLGSGTLEPPPGGTDYQMVFRFANEAQLAAWARSPQRQAWLDRGRDLVHEARAVRAQGLEGWFGTSAPPRWKQAVTIWLVFFPVSLAFTAMLGHYLEALPLFWRVLFSTTMLTPIMVFVFIPLATRVLRRWLVPQPHGVDVRKPA
ncbi:antibiotic biosynthesis monooxygenase [Verticiella sediminum]|uniref:Antibiotic biosynthesis monooxygenase n=1 Tax=Verticiella sediminum TaxID=1247510 RepID=A0A556AMS2_9BURK|nr:antibiotic biosynthesis monooxygenase [Verticiella sediminum]TSH94167.1 antibiotic biosynthesis monooxygenase [Verticiella sediminum]